MSVAYFIVLDKEIEGYDPFINGNFLAKYSDLVTKECKKNNIKTIDNFVSQDMNEIIDITGEDFFNNPTVYFNPDDGLTWIDNIKQKILPTLDPKIQKEYGADLAELESVLQKAKVNNKKWHFEIDI